MTNEYIITGATGKFLIAELGSRVSAQCDSVRSVSTYQWVGPEDGLLVNISGVTVMGRVVVIDSVLVSHNGLQFSCQGLDSTGAIIYAEHFSLIASVPADSVHTFLIDDQAQILSHGSSHSITCCYNTSLSAPSPSLRWLENGLEISSGVTVDDQCSTLTLPVVYYTQNNWVYTCSSEWSEPFLSIGPSTAHSVQTVLMVLPPPSPPPPPGTTWLSLTVCQYFNDHLMHNQSKWIVLRKTLGFNTLFWSICGRNIQAMCTPM